MSTAPTPRSPVPPDGTPRAIRAALLREDVGDFDREYRQVMAEATESLDLTGVLAMLARWRIVALSSRDEHAHRHMLDTAERLTAGEQVSTEPWTRTKARLGL